MEMIVDLTFQSDVVVRLEDVSRWIGATSNRIGKSKLEEEKIRCVAFGWDCTACTLA